MFHVGLLFPVNSSMGKISVALLKEVVELKVTKWRTCGIKFCLGIIPSFPYVKNYVQKHWSAYVLSDVTSNG